MTNHHPEQDVLIDYAAGSLREPMALLVATHLSLCPHCQSQMHELDRVGGALLESMTPDPVSANALDSVLARLGSEPQEAVPVATGHRASSDDPVLPRPLRDYVAGPLEQLPWKEFGSLAQVQLLPDFPGFKTKLLRIRRGAAMPRHTHGGNELTLVLAGGFTDGSGHFLRGDVATANPDTDHIPVADPDEDCYCLAVTDAPLRLTGPVGRYLNFLFRY